MKLPPSSFTSSRAGFSLIEIILALGIIAFALVGILGLFPVALDSAVNSQRETQAALIARSIFDQLKAAPEFTKRAINIADTYTSSSPSAIDVDLTTAKTLSPIGYDAEGGPLPSSSDPAAAYLAQVVVAPITTPTAIGTTQVSVVVKPVNAPKITYPFVSILPQK